MTHKLLFPGIFVLLLAQIGCGEPSATGPPPREVAPNANEGHGRHGHDSHDGHAHGGEDELSDMEKMNMELAKLSPADAASAEKQHICPVTEEMLGTMGAPIKVDVNGQDVWICCEGCRDALLENPSKFLAKLKRE